MIGTGGGGPDARRARLERLRAAPLYLVTDHRLPEAELLERLEAALVAGARVVQYRSKTADRREFLRGAERVQRLCAQHGALFIVNDATDVAAAIEADGVHLGQDDLPPGAARRVIGPDALIGFSISAVDEARIAAQNPAVDYLGVGAMYPTPTKVDAEYGGPELLRAVRGEAGGLPLVAIGGITLERAAEVWDAGADALAVVSAVFGSADVAAATRALLASRA